MIAQPPQAEWKMLVEVYDDDLPAVVWLFCGASNEDSDFERWLASMARLDRAIGARRAGIALLIIDKENPPPPRQHRDALTATARAIQGTTPLAVVTSSSVARTIIAGLHLARIVSFPLKGFADVETAQSWLLDKQGNAAETAAPALRSLIDEARARAERQRR